MPTIYQQSIHATDTVLLLERVELGEFSSVDDMIECVVAQNAYEIGDDADLSLIIWGKYKSLSLYKNNSWTIKNAYYG